MVERPIVSGNFDARDLRAKVAADPTAQPLVSVGLLSYNRPEGLRQALEGIVSQTHRNLEILVTDNASTDPAVGEIIGAYAARDPRIRWVRQPENIGFIRNFRYAFENTRSGLFLWAADDDVMLPEYIEVCLHNMLTAKYPVALSFTHLRKVRADGSVVNPDFADPVHTATPGRLRRSIRYLLFSGGNQCCYGLYRREAVSPWFFKRRFANDHLALLDTLRHGNIHIDPRVLFISTAEGTGFQRQNFHTYYPPENIRMKVAVNLSSTLTWLYEFLRFIALTPYKPHEKAVLWLFAVLRFIRPRYVRRFAGDMRALLLRRDIWNFRRV
jgi:glycosyltransferase involved in cell wall biosynthesis